MQHLWSCDAIIVQVFTVEVTEDFLDYLEYGTLSVEVYGHRRTGFTNNEQNPATNEDGQAKSFPERCVDVDRCDVTNKQ